MQDYGNKARKLEGQKLGLDNFAHFLDVPVSDVLCDMFALFDEVNTLCTSLLQLNSLTAVTADISSAGLVIILALS